MPSSNNEEIKSKLRTFYKKGQLSENVSAMSDDAKDTIKAYHEELAAEAIISNLLLTNLDKISNSSDFNRLVEDCDVQGVSEKLFLGKAVIVSDMVEKIDRVLTSPNRSDAERRRLAIDILFDANDKADSMSLKLTLVDVCKKQFSNSGIYFNSKFFDNDKKSTILSVILNTRRAEKLENGLLKLKHRWNDGLTMYIDPQYTLKDVKDVRKTEIDINGNKVHDEIVPTQFVEVKLYDNNMQPVGAIDLKEGFVKEMEFLADKQKFYWKHKAHYIDKNGKFFGPNLMPVDISMDGQKIAGTFVLGLKLFFIAQDGSVFDEDGNRVVNNKNKLEDRIADLIKETLNKIREVLASNLSDQEKREHIKEILIETINIAHKNMALQFKCIDALKKICKDNNISMIDNNTSVDEYLDRIKHGFVWDHIDKFQGVPEFKDGLLMLKNGSLEGEWFMYIDPKLVSVGKNKFGNEIVKVNVFDNYGNFVGEFEIEEKYLAKFKDKTINLKEGLNMPKNNDNNLVNGSEEPNKNPNLMLMSNLLGTKKDLLDKNATSDEMVDELKADVVEMFALTETNPLRYSNSGIELLEKFEHTFYEGLPREVHNRLDAYVLDAEYAEQILGAKKRFEELCNSNNISVAELDSLNEELAVLKSEIVERKEDGHIYSSEKKAVSDKYLREAEELSKKIEARIREMEASNDQALVKFEEEELTGHREDTSDVSFEGNKGDGNVGTMAPDLVISTGNLNADLLKPKPELKPSFFMIFVTWLFNLLRSVFGLNKKTDVHMLGETEKQESAEKEETTNKSNDLDLKKEDYQKNDGFEASHFEDQDENEVTTATDEGKKSGAFYDPEDHVVNEPYILTDEDLENLNKKPEPPVNSNNLVDESSVTEKKVVELGKSNLLSKVKVVAQNIVESGADVIVNSGCTGSGRGVDRAIFDNFNIQGGFGLGANRAILREATSKNSKVKTSCVILTSPNGDIEKLEGLYFEIFDGIVKSGAKSAAVPLIGNGAFRISLEDAAERLVNAFEKYQKPLNIDLSLCLYGDRIKTRSGETVNAKKAVEIVKKMIDERLGRVYVIDKNKSKNETTNLSKNVFETQNKSYGKLEKIEFEVDKYGRIKNNNLEPNVNNENKNNGVKTEQQIKFENVDKNYQKPNNELEKKSSVNDYNKNAQEPKISSENPLNHDQENYYEVKTVGDSLYKADEEKKPVDNHNNEVENQNSSVHDQNSNNVQNENSEDNQNHSNNAQVNNNEEEPNRIKNVLDSLYKHPVIKVEQMEKSNVNDANFEEEENVNINDINDINDNNIENYNNGNNHNMNDQNNSELEDNSAENNYDSSLVSVSSANFSDFEQSDNNEYENGENGDYNLFTSDNLNNDQYNPVYDQNDNNYDENNQSEVNSVNHNMNDSENDYNENNNFEQLDNGQYETVVTQEDMNAANNFVDEYYSNNENLNQNAFNQLSQNAQKIVLKFLDRGEAEQPLQNQASYNQNSEVSAQEEADINQALQNSIQDMQNQISAQEEADLAQSEEVEKLDMALSDINKKGVNSGYKASQLNANDIIKAAKDKGVFDTYVKTFSFFGKYGKILEQLPKNVEESTRKGVIQTFCDGKLLTTDVEKIGKLGFNLEDSNSRKEYIEFLRSQIEDVDNMKSNLCKTPAEKEICDVCINTIKGKIMGINANAILIEGNQNGVNAPKTGVSNNPFGVKLKPVGSKNSVPKSEYSPKEQEEKR